ICGNLPIAPVVLDPNEGNDLSDDPDQGSPKRPDSRATKRGQWIHDPDQGSALLFRQIIHEDLGCASYLIGDEQASVAVVVDPQWDIDPYLRLSRLHGVRIEHVLETKNPADHVSGHGRLARATGATIHIHELADVEYPH